MCFTCKRLCKYIHRLLQYLHSLGDPVWFNGIKLDHRNFFGIAMPTKNTKNVLLCLFIQSIFDSFKDFV